MHRRALAAPLLLASLTAVAAAGCTDQVETPVSGSTPTSATPSSAASSSFDPKDQMVTVREPAFGVETSAVRGGACYEASSADLGSIDYSWKAAADVTVESVELIDAEGVRLVGAQTVPPVNRGGDIPVGGEFAWGEPGADVGRRFIRWDEREPADQHVYSAGDTGLFVLHLRYAPGQGTSAGLRVRYTVDGEKTAPGPYTAEVRNELRWQVVRGKEKCHL